MAGGTSAMDSKAIEDLIERAYEARRTEDIEGIVGVFHPDGKFELAGSKDATAVAGVAKGHQELRTTLSEFIANFKFIQRDIVSTLIDGNRAAVHSRVKLRFVPKDRTATTEFLDLWKFENGNIVELVEFADTAHSSTI
jgi:ketosteroid isomerase-like protein